MKWQILCLTMPTRKDFLARLRKNIEPQLVPGVDLWIVEHTPAMSLGANREWMRTHATAEYICFVDDDDLVSDAYVDTILPLLDRDYVGFKLQCYEDGVRLKGPTYHSLLCGGWWQNSFAYYRDISHLNPMRRELAIQAPMYGGFAEDSRWAGDMRKLGIVRTEHFIEDTMYHYYSRTDKTDGVRPGPVTAGKCQYCTSISTVLVEGAIWCNRCGRSTP